MASMTIEERLEAMENVLMQLGISPYATDSLSASFYPSKYSGEEIDALLDKVEGGYGGAGGVNKNLLDNWYFVGGGTDGNFPVNQRGQTNYTTGGYNVDRWICNDAGVSVVATGLSVPAGYFYQRLPGKLLAGKTVTMSVLFANGELISGTGSVSMAGIVDLYSNGNTRLYSQNDSENDFIAFVLAIPTARTVVAMKLELGSTQTLVRQTDSGWELLSVPDYGTELAKCQRYMVVFKSINNKPYFTVANAHASTASLAVANVILPVPMRTLPAVQVSGSFQLLGSAVHVVSSMTVTNGDSVNVVVLDVRTESTLTTGDALSLRANNDPDAYILFNANL